MNKLACWILGCGVAVFCGGTSQASELVHAAILNENIGTVDVSIVDAIANALKQASVDVKLLTAAELSDETIFNKQSFSYLVLTNSPQFPLGASRNVDQFVRSGGHLILMGGHPFSDCRALCAGQWVKAGMTLYEGQWIPPRQAIHAMAKANAMNTQVLFDFEKSGLKNWRHKPGAHPRGTRLQLAEGRFGKAALLNIKNFAVGSWDLYESALDTRIGANANFLSLWAKGDAGTPLASLTVREEDGTEWVAVIPLTQQWDQYVFHPTDFRFHESPHLHRGGKGDSLKLSSIIKVVIGLSAYAHPDPGNHKIWFDEIGAFEAQVVSNLPCAPETDIDFFGDYEPILLSDSVNVSVEPGNGIIDVQQTLKPAGAIYHVQGFTVADRCTFIPLLQARDENGRTTGCAGGIVVNYDERYKGSCWTSFGAVSAEFYKDPRFLEMLHSVIRAIEQGESIKASREENEKRKAMDAQFGPFNYVLSTQAFHARYQFTEESLLLESARRISEMGSNVLKCEITSRAFDIYYLPANPAIKSLRDMVEKEPSYRQILGMPFDYYQFWAYPFCFKETCWFDGLSEVEKEGQYREIYDFTEYLLTRFSGSRKTFYLGHWEGDWMLLKATDLSKDPNDVAIQGMIDWLNIRQKAIDDAKSRVQHANVEVYHYTEVVAALKSIKGGKTLTNNVLPKTNVDYVSYSSYDSFYQATWNDGFGKTLKKSLDYIESKLPPKDISGKRVFIGEYGFPQAYARTPQEQDHIMRLWASAALEWGCPFVLYWQLYCNTGVPQSGGLRGFWLINDQNKKMPTYITHYNFFQQGREFVYDFRCRNARNPSFEEYKAAALKWLD